MSDIFLKNIVIEVKDVQRNYLRKVKVVHIRTSPKNGGIGIIKSIFKFLGIDFTVKQIIHLIKRIS
jgi:D-alanine-D-alanine ligase-like ATP-grasp enzyme